MNEIGQLILVKLKAQAANGHPEQLGGMSPIVPAPRERLQNVTTFDFSQGRNVPR